MHILYMRVCVCVKYVCICIFQNHENKLMNFFVLLLTCQLIYVRLCVSVFVYHKRCSVFSSTHQYWLSC